MATQDDFYTCYRGRQSAIYHASYLRLRKVYLALDLLREANISLDGKDIFDYGFGSGTFFRHLPQSCSIFGVEIDRINVAHVSGLLKDLGYAKVDLEPIEIETWEAHPLLNRKYDMILCSHVLEHLKDPVFFLQKMKECLKPDGIFIGLVPIHERSRDPHHEQICDAKVIRSWAAKANLMVKSYREEDTFTYWAQPLYTHSHGFWHKLQQAISLTLGSLAGLFPPRFWWRLSRGFGTLTLSRPTQAAFLLNTK